MSPQSALPSLPNNAADILSLAARSMFELFANASEGMLLVDREARVVWINDQYRRFLPALGFANEADFVGQPVSQVIQNTQMHQVLRTGKPILIDLLDNRAGTFVVSRIPLRDEGGAVIGALGIVLFDHAETALRPLMDKFAKLQRELDDTRRELATQRKQNREAARQAKHSLASFVGTSPAALEVKRQARRAAVSSSPVLLLGETGTGKELLAQGIHQASRRSAGPFVGVNLAAVPETLLEAEFFGVAPGAYTGADRRGREGKFVLADGGTLFLDEVGDMPPSLQAKLLRALQEGEIEPLGSNRLLKVDVRIVAATSRDLPAMVREGCFRADLYYRLGVLPLRVPPLRERRGDLPQLVAVLSEDLAQRGTEPPDLGSEALDLLGQMAWRGNIRELRNVLEQAALLSDGRVLEPDLWRRLLADAGVEPLPAAALPLASQGGVATAAAGAGENPLLRPWAEQVAELEQAALQAALKACGGNKLQAARLLGVARGTVYHRLRAGTADPG